MPTVSVDKERFYATLGKKYTTQEFDELCFQFGIELDDDTTDAVKGTDERPTLKIDIPANRYDLLCHEGISRALLVFLGKFPQPQLKLSQPAQLLECHIKESVKDVRPFVSCAVLRNIKFTPENYASFIDLQDKLHQNLGRRRTLLSMGTHDLDTIKGPFTYEALPPKDIKFAPLNKPGQVMDGPTLMTALEQDRHLKPYLSIIRDKPLYPVILDAERTVCSLPPIINSEHSKITLETRNVFIDMTATDRTKMAYALTILCAMFTEYCSEPFTIEPVKMVHADGTTEITPDLSPRRTPARISYINRCTGLDLDAPSIVKFLERMGHQAELPSAEKPDELIVDVACTRPDVLHECDLMEDVAVAFGFDNLPRRFPSTNTVAKPLPINKLSDLVRRECAYSGWTEVLPLILCSHDENFAALRRKDDGTTAIVLENPKTAEYQVVRTSLLPGMLKTIRENRKHALPMRTFEVSDVAFKDEESDPERCAVNERRVAAVYCDKSAAFEVIHGLLDRLMRSLDVPRIQKDAKGKGKGYYISESDDPTFFPGRAATIHFRPATAADPSGKADDLSSTGPPAAPIVDSAAISKAESGSVPVAQGNAAASSSGVVEQAGSALSTMADSLGKAIAELTSASSSTLSRRLQLKKAEAGAAVAIGTLGVVHPEVLKAFEIDYPCSAMEFDLEPFL